MTASPLKILLFLVWLAGVTSAWAGVYDEILIAARDNRTEQVIDLVRRGMDPNTSDPSGTTLLMLAANSGNEQLLDFLLRSRANILKYNKYGDSALGLAALRGHGAIVRRLIEAGAALSGPAWTPLQYAAYAGHAEVVRLLLAGKPELDRRAPNRQTALMVAARNGHLEVVKLLIEADADMDLTDADGLSAMGLARKAGNTEIADYLKRQGALE
jgi:ankyrin repeat protein